MHESANRHGDGLFLDVSPHLSDDPELAHYQCLRLLEQVIAGENRDALRCSFHFRYRISLAFSMASEIRMRRFRRALARYRVTATEPRDLPKSFPISASL